MNRTPAPVVGFCTLISGPIKNALEKLSTNHKLEWQPHSVLPQLLWHFPNSTTNIPMDQSPLPLKERLQLRKQRRLEKIESDRDHDLCREEESFALICSSPSSRTSVSLSSNSPNSFQSSQSSSCSEPASEQSSSSLDELQYDMKNVDPNSNDTSICDDVLQNTITTIEKTQQLKMKSQSSKRRKDRADSTPVYRWTDQIRLRRSIAILETRSGTYSGPAFAQTLGHWMNSTPRSNNSSVHDQEQILMEWLEKIAEMEDLCTTTVSKEGSESYARGVHFCTYDFSTAFYGQENNSAVVIQEKIELFECILTLGKKIQLRSHDLPMIETFLQVLDHQLDHVASNYRMEQCILFFIDQFSRLLQVSEPPALPFHDQFSDFISSQLRSKCRQLFNGTICSEIEPFCIIKPNTGTSVHNDDNLAALVTFALKAIENEVHSNESSTKSGLNSSRDKEVRLETQRQKALAKLFLAQLTSWSEFLEHTEKYHEHWKELQYYAELLVKYECQEKSYFRPFLNFKKFCSKLQDHVPALEQEIKDIKKCLHKGKKAVTNRRYEKNQFQYPKLQIYIAPKE